MAARRRRARSGGEQAPQDPTAQDQGALITLASSGANGSQAQRLDEMLQDGISLTCVLLEERVTETRLEVTKERLAGRATGNLGLRQQVFVPRSALLSQAQIGIFDQEANAVAVVFGYDGQPYAWLTRGAATRRSEIDDAYRTAANQSS